MYIILAPHITPLETPVAKAGHFSLAHGPPPEHSPLAYRGSDALSAPSAACAPASTSSRAQVGYPLLTSGDLCAPPSTASLRYSPNTCTDDPACRAAKAVRRIQDRALCQLAKRALYSGHSLPLCAWYVRAYAP